ncbi:Hypp1528 [Branchiostoma lanceolatum]|uniref:Hypp1528 protein n=1 Tax=Branchiostoma lanceolatum TaxID=7740 RepID=A0A8K0EL81_BRALA|nr:Hypp1528 [Branchiostoma lanceolatum]
MVLHRADAQEAASQQHTPGSSQESTGQTEGGRPEISWRMDTEEEMRSISNSWHDLRKKTQRRVQWRIIIDSPMLQPGQMA